MRHIDQECLQRLSEQHGIISLEMMPPAASPLFLNKPDGQAAPLFIQLDPIMGRYVLIEKKWDEHKIQFLKQILKQSTTYTLIDAGSNIGLFSRQCLSHIQNIQTIHCYEPEPRNFELLQRNIGFWPQVTLHPFGLSSEKGSHRFYLDPDNTGNYSLYAHAMRDNRVQVQVQMLSAQDESQQWLQSSAMPFIYKSDTQGHDEWIACHIHSDFWPRVKCAFFEIWRMKGKTFNTTIFKNILDQFPYKFFEKNPSHLLTSEYVIDYAMGSDMDFDDLYAWRMS